MSLLASATPFRACSGDMYAGVPITEPTIESEPDEPGPLRVLIFTTLPEDGEAETGRLDVEEEQAQLLEALTPWLLEGLVVLEMPDDGRFRTLQTLLQKFQPHLLFFSGHGKFVESPFRDAQPYATLLFESETGGSDVVHEDQIAQALLGSSVQGVVHKAMWKDMLQVFNQLDAATTPTETAVAILRKQDIRIPVKAISCGVDQDEFFPDADIERSVIRHHFRLPLDVPVLLYVGRVDREKGLDYLVAAAAQLPPGACQIAIAGKGMNRDSLIEMAHELGIAERVTFLGYVDSEDLPLLLNCADAFVMPSWAELQSIATLEAMSCSKPILAANARALPELVEHGTNGFLFNPQNADSLAESIQLFLSMPERWEAMGQASLQRARPHQMEYTIKRYLEWYESILGRSLMVKSRRASREQAPLIGG